LNVAIHHVNLDLKSWPVDDDDQGSAYDGSGTTGTHQRYISNVIEETIVDPQTADQTVDLSSSPSLMSPSIEVTPPAESQTKRQPLSAPPSLYSNGSDSEDFDRDTEWETITSVNETYVNVDSNEDSAKGPPTGKLSIATGLSNAAKKVTGVWEGFANDVGNPNTLNVKDPIEKKQKYERGQLKDQPLWKQINKKFWWNEHMLKSFIELELHAWILPVMQGYVQSEHCEIEDRVFDFIIISRRSRERPGVNEQGAVANFVETEQILSIKVMNSIALMYRCKWAIIHVNYNTTYRLMIQIMMSHFYKSVVQSNGREAIIGTAYREAIQNLGNKNIDALAREVLNLQLLRLGVSEFIDGGISHYEEFENIFNDVWANNGDSISREYAGTSALKVVNDASNSLARMFQNTFKDFFRQATIDYILGNHSLDVFQELQQKFEASQPGDAERWAKIRANAIDISSSIVIVDNEERVDGWTFLSPSEPSTLMRNNNNSNGVQKSVVPLNKADVTGTGTNIRTNSRTDSLLMSPKNDNEDKRFMAFKAFRSNLVGEATKFDGGAGGTPNSLSNKDGKGTNEARAAERVTSKQAVNEVVDELVKACRDIGNADDGFVIEKPIIG
ncbi:9935_t:CDS:10, partial [Racocetra fulgida]